MALVKSIEKFSVSLLADITSVGTPLTKGQVTANCVPFITTRVTTHPSNPAWGYYNVRSYFSGSDVVVSTGLAAGRAIVVEVTVVEFDPASVRVQQVPYSILDTGVSGTAVIPLAVNLANTFAVHVWEHTTTFRLNAHGSIELAFGSTTQLDVSRTGTDGQVDGAAYVVEALSGDFTVQTIVSNFSAISATETITSPVTLSKSFVVSSYNANSGTNDDSDSVPYVQLLSPTELFIERMSASGSISATSFVVSFDAGNAGTVQHGVLRQTVVGGTASEDVAITQVNLAAAMAWIPASTSFRHGVILDTSREAISDSRVGLTFASDVMLRLQRSIVSATPTAGNENIYSWEVIEWDATVVPPVRRVLVRG